jgi:hemolysin III
VLAPLDREQSLREEIANSVSHGLGLVAAVVAIPFLLARAVRVGDAIFVAGVALFAVAMLLLYSGSTLYHGLPNGRAKRVFRVLEHSAIYILIAGSYSPFTLGVLRGPWGWTLFGIVWALAATGVLLKTLGNSSHPIVSTVLYVAMGWLVVVAAGPMLARVPTAGLLWLLAGGLSYTLGVAFYATDRWLHFGHAVWHLFVLAGTACHGVAVYRYAA